MTKKRKTKEENFERIYEDSYTKKELKEERMEESEKLLKASEWGKENGLPFQDFLWWDTAEGLITKERFNEIRKIIGR